MTYLFDTLADFVAGGRMTELWHNQLTDLGKGEELAAGHFIGLADHEHADVESDFLSSHSPFHIGGVGGVDPDGRPWTFIVQKAPIEVRPGGASPSAFLRAGVERALTFKPAAAIELEQWWTHQDLVRIYLGSVTDGADVPLLADSGPLTGTPR